MAAAFVCAIRFLPPYLSKPVWFAALCVATGIVFGSAAAILEESRGLVPTSERVILTGYSGVLLHDSRISKTAKRVFDIEVDSIEISTSFAQGKLQWPKARLSVALLSGPGHALDAGSRVEVAKLSIMDSTKNLHFADARNISVKPPFGLIPEFRGKIRAAAVRGIERVAGRSFPLAQALVLGIKDDLDSEVSTLFTSAGCAHILALSGQHLSIMCMLASLLTAKIFGKPRAVGTASMAFAIFFVWIAGPSPSLSRAVVMLIIAQISRMLDRPQKGISILSATFIFCFGTDPESARTLSFQLSYCAMVGLVLFAPRWKYFLEKCPLFRISKSFTAALAASLAALCATSPISLVSFGCLASGGIFAATASAPLVLIFIWSILISSMLFQWSSWLSGIFSAVHGVLYDCLVYVMKIGSSFPRLGTETGTPIWVLIPAVVCLSLFVYALPYIDSILKSRVSRDLMKIEILSERTERGSRNVK
jgi:ComEC/Rec2-related protein